MLSNKTYNILKWATLIGMPALMTFYGVVGTTCKLPYTQEILTIAGGFTTMLGSMLGISTINYNNSQKQE